MRQKKEGALQKFTFTFLNSDKVRQSGIVEAVSKQDAYSRLRRKGIRPIRVLAEGEEPPAVKKFFKEQKESAPEPEMIYIPAEEPRLEPAPVESAKPKKAKKVTSKPAKAKPEPVPRSPFPVPLKNRQCTEKPSYDIICGDKGKKPELSGCGGTVFALI